MRTQVKKQEKHREIILEGISNSLKTSEIASQLNVDKRIIKNDIQKMKRSQDPELVQAYKTANKRENTKSDAARAEKKFKDMTGMTLKEKTFINMLYYYRPELLEILKSKDENLAIQELSSSAKRCLKKHGIITKGWRKSEITSETRDYLSNPDHQIWEETKNE